MTTLVVVVAAVLAAAGAGCLVAAIWAPPTFAGRAGLSGWGWWSRFGDRRVGWWWRLPAGVVVGVVVTGVTGWPAAGWWMAVLAVWVPSMARRGRERQASIDRVEAVARWADMLRDQIRVGADVIQAVVGSARVAPTAIAPAVQALAARLQVMEPGEPLAAFAAEVDDPMAELLAVGLQVALTRRTARVSDLFAEVARATREQKQMRQAIEKDRRRLRTVVWGALTAVLGWLVLIFVVSGAYFAPYRRPAGQVVLWAAGAAFALGLGALARMDRVRTPSHLLVAKVAAR